MGPVASVMVAGQQYGLYQAKRPGESCLTITYGGRPLLEYYVRIVVE